MPVDEDDTLCDQVVGGVIGIFPGAAMIVGDVECQRATEDSAGRVDIAHRHFCAALQLFAKDSEIAAHRTGDTDMDGT